MSISVRKLEKKKTTAFTENVWKESKIVCL